VNEKWLEKQLAHGICTGLLDIESRLHDASPGTVNPVIMSCNKKTLFASCGVFKVASRT